MRSQTPSLGISVSTQIPSNTNPVINGLLRSHLAYSIGPELKADPKLIVFIEEMLAGELNILNLGT